MTIQDDPRLDDRFDALARDRYRKAADHVPTAVRWQLQPGIVSQRRDAMRAPARGWRAGAFAAAGMAAAAFVLALGLVQGPLPGTGGMPSSARTAAVATATGDTANDDDPATALDESPDFYAWLGSADVQQVAME